MPRAAAPSQSCREGEGAAAPPRWGGGGGVLAPAAAHLGGGHGHPELGGDGPQLLPVDVPGAVHVEARPGGLGGSRLGRPRALARGRHERQLDLEDVNAASLPPSPASRIAPTVS